MTVSDSRPAAGAYVHRSFTECEKCSLSTIVTGARWVGDPPRVHNPSHQEPSEDLAALGNLAPQESSPVRAFHGALAGWPAQYPP